MIYRINISLLQILDESIAQTSIDFSALRAVNPLQADAIYDDFTLSKDNAAETLNQMHVAGIVLSGRLMSCINKEIWTAEDVEYAIKTHNKKTDCRRIKVLIEEFIKGSVLAWWYSGRQAALSERYSASGEEIIGILMQTLTASTCERRLRWF